MSVVIYIDESGDLGWTFDQPYRRGGSSRYLTIAAIVVPSEKKHIPKRVVSKLYERHKWDIGVERKWTAMSPDEKMSFVEKTVALCNNHPDIKLYSCIAYKCGVQEKVKNDSNLLYNYMIKKMLLDVMSDYETVTIVPDPRSIKVKSGNSLKDYLQLELTFTKEADTLLTMQPTDSSQCRSLQFTDMLAGVVQGHFEDRKSDCWNILGDHIITTELYFPTT